MPFYRYQVKDGQGQLCDGELETSSLRGAVADLQQRGYTVLQIQACKVCHCGASAPLPGQACPECKRVASSLAPRMIKAGVLTLMTLVLGKLLHLF